MVAPTKLSTIKAAKLLGVKVGEADKVVLKAAYKKAALRDAAPRRARTTRNTHPSLGARTRTRAATRRRSSPSPRPTPCS